MLLLLHGALGSQTQFDSLRACLPPQVQTASFDFALHGQSEDRGGFSIPYFAAQLLAFMDERGIEKADVFGYSMGGYVALYLAKQQPERIGRLFTLATKLDWQEESAAAEARRLNPDKLLEKVPQYAAYLQSLHGTRWRELMLKTADFMTDLGRNPLLDWADFGQMQFPIRLALGDKDAMVSVEETLRAYRQLPQGELQVLPHTPHPLERVSASLLAAAMQDFFGF